MNSAFIKDFRSRYKFGLKTNSDPIKNSGFKTNLGSGTNSDPRTNSDPATKSDK